MLNFTRDRGPVAQSVAVGVVLLLAVVVASAQSGGSSLEGRVTDSTGRPVPGVKVLLTDGAGGQREATTDATGGYRFDNVPVGAFDVSASRPAFRRYGASVAISGAAPTHHDIVLAIGSLAEEVSIRANPGAPVRPAAARLLTPEMLAGVERRRAGCVVSAAGGAVHEPLKLIDVRPVYPESLASAEVGGTVMLEGTVGTDGAMKGVVSVNAAHPDLVAAAVDAVTQWKYSPTLLNCEPIDVSVSIKVNFIISREAPRSSSANR